ncbi:MAG: hypothetical protein DWQ01_19525 [Planctomycetota bacterium]|nr:MAG: hypothetical protein DWQ01_19525 [Planctomycetota bacterium]
MNDQIDLKQALSALRLQLSEVAAEGGGQDLRFEIPEIELELKVVASHHGQASGGIQFRLFGIGAKVDGGGGIKNEQVQTLKLKLKPVRPDGTDMLLEGELENY